MPPPFRKTVGLAVSASQRVQNAASRVLRSLEGEAGRMFSSAVTLAPESVGSCPSPTPKPPHARVASLEVGSEGDLRGWSFLLLPGVFPAQTLPQRGCWHGTHPLPIPGEPARQELCGPWPGPAAPFEGVAHPQQLSPLPLHPRDPFLESKGETTLLHLPKRSPEDVCFLTPAPPCILHILNRAAWLQPLPSDLHDNRAAFQVHPVPRGGGLLPLPSLFPGGWDPTFHRGREGRKSWGALSPQPPLPQPEGLPEVLQAQGSGHRGGGGGGGVAQAGSPARLHPARRHSGPRDWAPCRRPGSCNVQSSPPACPPWAPPRGQDTPRSPGWGRRKGRDVFRGLGRC